MMRHYLVSEFDWLQLGEQKNTGKYIAIVTKDSGRESCFDVSDDGSLGDCSAENLHIIRVNCNQGASDQFPHLILVPGEGDSCIVLLRRVNNISQFHLFVLGASLPQGVSDLVPTVSPLFDKITEHLNATNFTIAPQMNATNFTIARQSYCFEATSIDVINQLITRYYADGFIAKDLVKLLECTHLSAQLLKLKRQLRELDQEFLSVERLLTFHQKLSPLNPVSTELTGESAALNDAFHTMSHNREELQRLLISVGDVSQGGDELGDIQLKCNKLSTYLSGLLSDQNGLAALLRKVPSLDNAAGRSILWAHLLYQSSLWRSLAESGCLRKNPLSAFKVARIADDPRRVLEDHRDLLEEERVNGIVASLTKPLSRAHVRVLLRAIAQDISLGSRVLEHKVLGWINLNFPDPRQFFCWSRDVSNILFVCPGIKDTIKLCCDFMAMLHELVRCLVPLDFDGQIILLKQSFDSYLQFYVARLVLLQPLWQQGKNDEQMRASCYLVFEEMVLELKPYICDLLGNGKFQQFVRNIKTTIFASARRSEWKNIVIQARESLNQLPNVKFAETTQSPGIFAPIQAGQERADSAAPGGDSHHSVRRRSLSF